MVMGGNGGDATAEASQRGLRGVKRTKARRLEASEEAERDT